MLSEGPSDHSPPAPCCLQMEQQRPMEGQAMTQMGLGPGLLSPPAALFPACSMCSPLAQGPASHPGVFCVKIPLALQQQMWTWVWGPQPQSEGLEAGLEHLDGGHTGLVEEMKKNQLSIIWSAGGWSAGILESSRVGSFFPSPFYHLFWIPLPVLSPWSQHPRQGP